MKVAIAAGAGDSVVADGATVPSPCINICRMQAQLGLCEGCLRTLEEITAWSQLDDAGKRVVWAAIDGRRALMPPATQGPGCGGTP